MPNATQQAEVHMYKPDVPEFWTGFYAIFEPKKDSRIWVKRWFANEESKTYKSAFKSMPVEEAHAEWNNFLNQ